MSLETIAQDILDHGHYPDLTLSLDEQVQLTNIAADNLRDRASQGEDLDDEASNFVVWLGGQHRDIMLYGIQRILKPQAIGVVFEEKAQARINSIEEKLNRCSGYQAGTFETIDHHGWPVEYLDGSTYEDRLQRLVDEESENNPLEIVSPDMILKGVGHNIAVDMSTAYAQSVACLVKISEHKEDFNAPEDSVAYQAHHERINHFMNWLDCQGPEMSMMGVRSLLAIHKVKFDRRKIQAWSKFQDLYEQIILK